MLKIRGRYNNLAPSAPGRPVYNGPRRTFNTVAPPLRREFTAHKPYTTEDEKRHIIKQLIESFRMDYFKKAEHWYRTTRENIRDRKQIISKEDRLLYDIMRAENDVAPGGIVEGTLGASLAKLSTDSMQPLLDIYIRYDAYIKWNSGEITKTQYESYGGPVYKLEGGTRKRSRSKRKQTKRR